MRKKPDSRLSSRQGWKKFAKGSKKKGEERKRRQGEKKNRIEKRWSFRKNIKTLKQCSSKIQIPMIVLAELKKKLGKHTPNSRQGKKSRGAGIRVKVKSHRNSQMRNLNHSPNQNIRRR